MRRSLFCVNPLTQAGSNAAQSDPAWPPHHGNRSSPIALIALITLITLPILITQIDCQNRGLARSHHRIRKRDCYIPRLNWQSLGRGIRRGG